MKSYPKIVAAFFAACCITVAAIAADASPTGVWKWTQQGRQGGQGFERKVKLELKDGKLTGALLPSEGPMGTMPEAPISDGTFKVGVVAFAVTREFNGQSFTIKYQAKLDGDTLKGTSEFPGFNGGEPRKMDWEAKREK
jgi:hypothetical protein